MRLLPLAFFMLVVQSRAADLAVGARDQDHIVLDVYSDVQCPLVCGACEEIPRCPSPPCSDSIACCDTFAAIVANHVARPLQPDFTFLNGDLGIESHASIFPWLRDKFFDLWNVVPDPKSYGMGNHEADPAWNPVDSVVVWADPENHYAPANWWDPVFGCDSTTALPECTRWYAVHIGSPPRVALLVLSNNSDSEVDEFVYPYCMIPFDSLNTAGSSQREWLNDHVSGLPPTVEVVFVACHRTYYGVEDADPPVVRPNILYSYVDPDTSVAPAETLRTGAVSLLRDVESIHERNPGVKKIFMINGDQHCFAETVPIRENVRDDLSGVVYLTVGISGACNNRGSVFPKLNKIPPGTLVYAFDDKWGTTRFEIFPDQVAMTVFEAYTDSVLYQTSWPFATATGAPGFDAARAPPESPELEVWPNPATDGVEVAFRLPAALQWLEIAEMAVYDVGGRRIRSLHAGRYSQDAFRRTWDLLDSTGARVASGTYFVVVRFADGAITQPVTVRQ